jgi:methyl-accepting chemotaxis protein
MQKKGTIRFKLISLVLASLIVLASVITYVAISKASESLLDAQFDKLSTMNVAKKGEIENYFSYLEGLLISLAENQGTQDAFVALDESFYKLSSELDVNLESIKSKLSTDFENNYLNSVNYKVPNSAQRRSTSDYLPSDINGLIAQYIFITDNSAKLGEKNSMHYNPKYDSSYMQAHKKYHHSFDKFLVSYDLYDIFMVDLKGNLIYTDFKEKDFGTNLKSGVYSNTGIARAYNKALNMDRGQIAFEDFASYEPSYNSSASFIATPIFIDGQKKGVLIFQMPVDQINSVMQFNGKFKAAGLGESGECYLIGQDYKMRSNSRFQKDINDKVVKELGSTIGVWRVATDSTKAALNNQSGKGVIQDYRGINVLSVYDSINIFSQSRWAIVAEIDESEALAPAHSLRTTIIIISIVVLLLALVVVLAAINNVVVRPLESFRDGLLGFFKFVNKETHDVALLNDTSNDEIGRMSKVINSNIEQTKAAIEAEQKLIEESAEVMGEFEQGDMYQRINGSSNNPALNQLKDVINKMGNTMEFNIERVLRVLEDYSNYNYINRIEEKDLKEHLLKLSKGVNSLGVSITSMLVENKVNGLTLQDSADTLFKNVETLNVSTNQAASSLEETSAVLEQITSNLAQNGESVSKMSSYANILSDSATEGEKLANQTTISMDAINTQISSINEAINVIDQIAFQTNILSLNAAVEAATAGEAGKGFAVVAGEVRNLASRSADAANEIKDLVHTATQKADEGKVIADKMISGYNELKDNISKTLDVISDVESASKEQQVGITQINDAVAELDQQTQQNAQVSAHTKDIALQTQTIASTIVVDADKKEFEGKNSAKARSIAVDGIDNIADSNDSKPSVHPPLPSTSQSTPSATSNSINNNENWESF